MKSSNESFSKQESNLLSFSPAAKLPLMAQSFSISWIRPDTLERKELYFIAQTNQIWTCGLTASHAQNELSAVLFANWRGNETRTFNEILLDYQNDPKFKVEYIQLPQEGNKGIFSMH